MVLLDSCGIPRAPQYSGGQYAAARPFAYGAVTLCGGPFQVASARPTVGNCARVLQHPDIDSHNPVLKTAVTLQQHGLGSSLFARRYSGNRGFFLFLGVLRCFSSPGWASRHLWIQWRILRYDPQWVPPFGNPRINACLRLPVAYRSSLRPSSPPSAKAFAVRP